MRVPTAISRRGLLATALTFAAAPPLQPRPCAAGPPAGYVPLDTVDATKVAFNAVEQTFSQEFAALLSRFLVKNEASAARWWDQKQKEARTFEAAKSTVVDSPFRRLAEEREEYYLENAFSSLITSVEVGLERFEDGATGTARLGSLLQQRYCSAAASPAQKRSLAQLLSLIENPTVQPTGTIRALLGEADDARVESLVPSTGRFGRPGEYCVSSATPEIIISPPPGRGAKAAKARAKTAASGRWRAVQIIDGGSGYAEGEEPEVRVPRAPYGASTASVRARTRNGAVVELLLEDPGAGYVQKDGVTPSKANILKIAPPAGAPRGGRAARAVLLPEYALIGVEVVEGGGGYFANEPPTVIVRDGSLDGPSGTATVAAGAAVAPSSKNVTLVATLKLPRSREAVPPDSLRELDGALRTASRGDGLFALKTSKGYDLPLLPSDLVPVRDSPTDPFRLPIELPRGSLGMRAALPVETQTPLSPSDVSRIFLAGAVCSSTAHTVLVPIDVVKTAMQQDGGETFDGPLDCAAGLVERDGPGALLRGAGPTIAGYAVAGALAFGFVDVFGRVLRTAAGPGNALLYASPLLALASVMATGICACAVCPFEAVRILSVQSGQPGTVVLREVLAAEGPAGLFRGLPPLLLKEVPFVVTKFVTFDLASTALAAAVDNAGLTSSAGLVTMLTVASGAVAGVAAILVSQPADAVFTLANDEGGTTLSEAVAQVRERPAVIANGLLPRLVFGVLLVTLQFYFFSEVRAALGVSKNDLTLVWDALAPLRAST